MNRKDATRLKSIDDLYIFSRTGKVHGATTWSETRVSGGGSSGHIYNGSGHISSSSVTSSVTERQRFFIVEPDERETEITDAGIGVRDGQTVSVVYCGHKTDKVGWETAYYNHQTGSRTELDSSIRWLSGGGNVWARVGLTVLAGIVAQAIAVFVLGMMIGIVAGSILGWIAFAGAIFWVWKKTGGGGLGSKVPAVEIKAAVQREIDEAKTLVQARREEIEAA